MKKTQVQIPDELYRKAKQIAKEREWSLAEVMRRGLVKLYNLLRNPTVMNKPLSTAKAAELVGQDLNYPTVTRAENAPVNYKLIGDMLFNIVDETPARKTTSPPNILTS